MITIEGEIHSSKNSRRIFKNRHTGQPFVAKSKAAKADESMLEWQLVSQLPAWREMAAGHQYPYRVIFHFIRATRRRWDFANLVQGIADAMVKAGYMPDDDVEHFVPVFGGWSIDGARPGCDFWIESEPELTLCDVAKIPEKA